jgi:hypothetical protein
LQDVFEIGRRYKIMNPEKMRSEFGKLMYMLMDSADSHVQVSGTLSAHHARHRLMGTLGVGWRV